jgi:hypothetical protein
MDRAGATEGVRSFRSGIRRLAATSFSRGAVRRDGWTVRSRDVTPSASTLSPMFANVRRIQRVTSITVFSSCSVIVKSLETRTTSRQLPQQAGAVFVRSRRRLQSAGGRRRNIELCEIGHWNIAEECVPYFQPGAWNVGPSQGWGRFSFRSR